MAYIGLTRGEQAELGKVKQVPSYDKLIHETTRHFEEAIEILDNMDVFVVPMSEFTQEFYDREPGPIRMKVVTPESDEPGIHKQWLKKDWRWVMKEGVDMLRSFREGDEITISQEMHVDLVRAALQFSGAVGKELKMQQTLSYSKRFEIGRKIKFVAKRMDRFRVFLTMGFSDDPEEGMWNLEIPRLAGFCFIEPDSPELGILECPEEFLNERELVLKGIMKYYDCNEARAEAELVAVEKAMAEHGICFYRP
jgi:hypothetical protein